MRWRFRWTSRVQRAGRRLGTSITQTLAGVLRAQSRCSVAAGRVVAVTGTGKDRRVIVDFGAIGKKTVLAKFLDPASSDGLN